VVRKKKLSQLQLLLHQLLLLLLMLNLLMASLLKAQLLLHQLLLLQLQHLLHQLRSNSESSKDKGTLRSAFLITFDSEFFYLIS
jgi:hypothetical protein